MVSLRHSVLLLQLLQTALGANIRRRDSITTLVDEASSPSSVIQSAAPSSTSFTGPVQTQVQTTFKLQTREPASKDSVDTVTRTTSSTSTTTSVTTSSPHLTTIIGENYYDSVDDIGGCHISGKDGLYVQASSYSGAGYQPCVYTYVPTETVGENKGPITSTLYNGTVVYCTSAAYVNANANSQKTCVGSQSVISTNTAIAASYFSSSSAAVASMEASKSSSSVAASPTAAVWFVRDPFEAGTASNMWTKYDKWAVFYADSGSYDPPDMCADPDYTTKATKDNSHYVGSYMFPKEIKFGSNKKFKDCSFQAATWKLTGNMNEAVDPGAGFFSCPSSGSSSGFNASCTGIFPDRHRQTSCSSDYTDSRYPMELCLIRPADALS